MNWEERKKNQSNTIWNCNNKKEGKEVWEL